MNSFNCVTLIGRIPKTDKIRYEFHEATNDDGTNARMNGCISVQRSRKQNKDDQYYPEDLIPFVTFGRTAEYMNNYVHLGDAIAMQGELEVNTVEGEDGGRRTYYSVRVDTVKKLPHSLADESGSEEEEKKPVKKPIGNPFAAKKSAAAGGDAPKKKSPFAKK